MIHRHWCDIRTSLTTLSTFNHMNLSRRARGLVPPRTPSGRAQGYRRFPSRHREGPDPRLRLSRGRSHAAERVCDELAGCEVAVEGHAERWGGGGGGDGDGC